MSYMMSAGDLDRTITFIGIGTTQDAFGQPIESTDALRSARAKRVALNSTDVARSQLISEVAEAKFLSRYVADVTTGMKIKENGTTYYIIGVEEIGRKEGLAITCKVAK